jgi:hypothetical protein
MQPTVQCQTFYLSILYLKYINSPFYANYIYKAKDYDLLNPQYAYMGCIKSVILLLLLLLPPPPPPGRPMQGTVASFSVSC